MTCFSQFFLLLLMPDVQRSQIHQLTAYLVEGAFQNGRQTPFNTVNDVFISILWDEMTHFFRVSPYAKLKCIGGKIHQESVSIIGLEGAF